LCWAARMTVHGGWGDPFLGGQDSLELGFQKSLQLEFDVYMKQQGMYESTNW